MVDHIVWDWNGTLLDDARAAFDASMEVLVARGLPAVTFERYRAAFTRPIWVFYERLFGWLPDADTFAGIDDDFHDAYRAQLSGCRLAADAHAALADWDASRGTQSLLSMWRHAELEPAVRSHGIAHRFRRVDGLTGPGGGRKAEHLANHLGALGVGGDSVVLVGDTTDDADAAAAAGARCVLYTGGYQDRAALETAGVPVADTLRGALDAIDGVRSS